MKQKIAMLLLSVVLAAPVANSGQLAQAAAAAKKTTTSRPNIVYFYVDDMGWGAIGPNGQAARKAKGLPYVQTPTLDQLAAQGVNFARCYGCTVCSPARSSQQTGFHQGHTFADRNDPDNAKKAIRADDRTIGDMLSKAGYVTGYWGKWGYGGSKDREAPVIDNVQTLPTSHGYRHVVAELHHVRAHTFFQPTLWNAPAEAGAIGGLELKPNSMAKYMGNPAYPGTPALQNHPDYPETAYCDDVYAFAALDFVRAQAQNYRATGQPFFALLACQIPHAPFGEIAQLPEWDRAYRDIPFFESLSDQSKQWAAMVTRIDAHFGNILAALEDPNGDGDCSDSVADNTLIVFQSDNGGPQHPANKEFDANGGLRGNKGKIYEGGIRIPAIMRWPAKITADSDLKAGTTTQRILDVSDLLPTFCELAGISPPTGIDGVSLAPTLLGTGHQRIREFVIHEAGGSQSIIRGNLKLIRNRSSYELYDLDADPSETTDIAAEHPALVEELAELLLGERVTEPKGFANTYHHWIGGNSGGIADADNWSDYVYANAGITYMKDDGAPQVSWTATIQNPGDRDATVKADTDVEFLSLEISGPRGSQTVVVEPGVVVTGRNEVRIAAGGQLALQGGVVKSLRWVETQAGGTLKGSGRVQATLYNAGSVSVQGETADATIQVAADYVECGDSQLHLALNGEPQLVVGGEAELAGTLSLAIPRGQAIPTGKTIMILKAEKVGGKFANADDEVVADNGARFEISYSPTSVTITAQ